MDDIYARDEAMPAVSVFKTTCRKFVFFFERFNANQPIWRKQMNQILSKHAISNSISLQIGIQPTTRTKRIKGKCVTYFFDLSTYRHQRRWNEWRKLCLINFITRVHRNVFLYYFTTIHKIIQHTNT